MIALGLSIFAVLFSVVALLAVLLLEGCRGKALELIADDLEELSRDVAQLRRYARAEEAWPVPRGTSEDS